MNKLFALSKTSANLLYFHYSGHGSSIRDTNRDEKDNTDEFIVPADYFVNGSKIIDDELLALTQNLNPSVPCFMVFDSCHSGTILDLNWCYTFNKSSSLFIQSPGTNTPSNSKNSIICISGCKDTEVSLDVVTNGSYNGALSNGLYNVLAEISAGQLISVGSVVINIYKYLMTKSFNQNPIISTQLPLNVNGIAFLKSTSPVPSRSFESVPVLESESEMELTENLTVSAEQTTLINLITDLISNQLMTEDQIKALVDATLLTLQ